MFAYENNTGKIFEILNFQSSTPGAISFQLVAKTAANISSNDGASCPDAPVPDFPINAVNDSDSTDIDTPVDVNWINNDDEATDGNFELDTFDTTSANGGTITDNGDGTFHYTPPAGFTGVDTFEYTICLTGIVGDPICDTAVVTITVTAEIDAQPDSDVTNVDVPKDVTWNSNDSASAPYSIDTFDTTSANGGTITDNGNGTFHYTPPAGFTGVDTFEYTICIDGSNPEICDTTTVTITILGPELIVEKLVDEVEHQPGDVVRYTINYSNSGDGQANNAALTETVPANTTYTGDASEGWVCADVVAGSSCVKTLGNLAAAQAGVAYFTVTVDSPLEESPLTITNTVVIDADNADPANSSVDINVKSSPRLEVVKGDDDITSGAGGVVVYTITYTNTGTRTEPNAVLTETVPANTTYTGDASEGWTCNSGGVAGDTCVYTIGALAPGQTGEVKFSVTVDEELPEGVDEINNTVVISGEGGEDSDDEQTPLEEGDVLGEVFYNNSTPEEPGEVLGSQELANTGEFAFGMLPFAIVALMISLLSFIKRRKEQEA